MPPIRLDPDGSLPKNEDVHPVCMPDAASHYHESGVEDASFEGFSSIYKLMEYAQLGHVEACENLYQLAYRICGILNDPRNLTSDSPLLPIVKDKTEWPVMIPAATNLQKGKLAELNSLPLGDDLPFKIYKAHLGDRRPGAQTPDSPAAIAQSVAVWLWQVRSVILRRDGNPRKNGARPWFADHYPTELLDKIRALTWLSMNCLEDWVVVAAEIAVIPSAKPLIPESWKSKGDKGRGAHLRKQFREGFTAILRTGGKSPD